VPKSSWNINDFSGGVNKIVDKRDIQDNESPAINNLISSHPGSIKLGGYFIPISASNSFPISSDENPALYLQPSSHFTKHYYIAAVTVTSGTGTLTTGDPNFGLSVGTEFSFAWTSVEQFNLNVIEKSYIIETDNGSGTYTFSYHTSGSIAGTAEAWIVVGAKAIDTVIDGIKDMPYSNPDKNRIILLNNGYGRFGYWDLYSKSFIGSAYGVNEAGLDKFLFSTQYLWDFNQVNQHISIPNIGSSGSINQHPSTIKTLETSYSDGVVRVVEDFPLTWHYGFCRRPMGYYYIPEHNKFGNNGIKYLSSWYPLRSHCLSPGEYRNSVTYDKDGFNQYGGTLTTSDQDTIGEMLSSGHLEAPDHSHQVNLCISGVTTLADGSWQCASSSEHNYIGLGISFIYDSIDQKTPGNFSQESHITKLTTDGESPNGSNESIQISNGVDDKSILLGIAVNLDNASTINNLLEGKGYPTVGETENYITQGELYSSVTNHGFSNYKVWNPRIVGANIWVTKFADELNEPLLLGSINFYGDSEQYGLSKSHDGVNSSEWAVTDSIHYQSYTIESVPIMDYFSHTGCDVKEQHQAWYKTSAVVNRKLYIGNVGYFSNVNPLDRNDSDSLELHPDKILMSVAPNKFDIHPVNAGLELAKFDGQDIICLKNFNSELLIYKSNDLYVVDCSDEDEILKDTFRGRGVHSQNHIVTTDTAVYFFNTNGLYMYDGNTINNLMIDKISPDKWRNTIYNDNSKIFYDNGYDLLLISTNYNIINDDNDSLSNNLLIYNVANNAIYFKDDISTGSFSHLTKGINIDNQLYLLASQNISGQAAATGISFNRNQTTAYTPGTKAWFTFMFQLTDVGTFGGAATDPCQKGALNNKCKYLKVLKENASGTSGDSWICMNSTPFSPPDDSNASDADFMSGTRNNYIKTMGYFDSFPWDHADYEFTSASIDFSTNETAILLKLKFTAKYSGLAYNVADTGVDLDDLGDPYDNFTHFQNNLQEWGFSTTTTEGTNVNDVFQANDTYGADAPNIGERTASNGQVAGMTMRYNGQDAVASVDYLTPDVGSAASLSAGTKFIIDIHIDGESAGSNISKQLIYEVGVNYWANDTITYDYVDESTLSGQSTINTGIVDNLYQALIDGKLDDDNDWSINQIFDIGKTSSYISLTANTGNIASLWSDFTVASIDTSTSLVMQTETFNTGKLLYWHTDLPKDAIGNSIIGSKDFLYETKDIDFGEPNVRKKIYKAYITYKGGNGSVVCDYQADQSGTWTNATVYDSSGSAATTTGILNDSSSQTRAELKFGTGGNNKYSFALRFVGGSGSDNFEINDITIIYRLKKAK